MSGILSLILATTGNGRAAVLSAALNQYDLAISPTNAVSGFKISTDGKAYLWNRVGNAWAAVAEFTWLTGTGTSANYEVLINETSGSGDIAATGDFDAWTAANLSPAVTLTEARNGYYYDSSGGTVQIRDASSHAVLASGTYAISSTVEV